ncbi:MAG: c-type cytochrome, partial [Rhodospirillaceae bacterium]
IQVPVPVNAVAFVAGGMIAVGGHDSTIRIYDTATGAPRGKMVGHKMGITELRASADGRRLLSSSIDKTLGLWDVAGFEAIRTLERHDSQVYGVRFTPDGKRAVSGGRDGFLMVWDLETGKLLKSFKGHDKIIWAVAISPDGRFAVSGSSDDTARVWHLASGDRIGPPAEEAGEPQPWLDSNHPGAGLYKKCARCHALTAEGARRSGPHFAGLFGRRVGTVEGYRYSDALKGRNFVWNEDTLFRLFDEGPDKFLPGTKMPVQRVTDRTALIHLVEYMKELTHANGTAQ